MGIPAIDIPHNDVYYEAEDPESDFPDEFLTLNESQIVKIRPCFGSDERYLCKRNCQWSKQCKKLRAAWLR